MAPPRRRDTYERFDAAMTVPMTILGILWIPIVEIPLLTSLPPALDHTFFVIDYVVWALFAAEYLVKLALAPSRREFVRHHLIDLIVVVLPLLRPLRVLRVVALINTARAGAISLGVAERRHHDTTRRRRRLVAVALMGAVTLVTVLNIAF